MSESKKKYLDEVLEVGKDIEKTLKYIPYLVGAIALVSVGVYIPIAIIPNSNDWIGFYGGLLGAVIGGFVTYKGVELSVTENKSQFEKSLNLLEKEQEDRKTAETDSIRPFISIGVLSENDKNVMAQNGSPISACKWFSTITFRNITNFYHGDEKKLFIQIQNIGRDSCWDYHVYVDVDIDRQFNRIEKDSYKLDLEKNCIAKNDALNWFSINYLKDDKDLVFHHFFRDLNTNLYYQKHTIVFGETGLKIDVEKPSPISEN